MAQSAWLTSEEAARRLGVKQSTLYAYVSRGLIRSERVPGQRRSRFRRVDVETQAARSARGGRAGGLEVVVETELTLLDPAGALFYRGWSVTEAARSAGFEQVATWLWTGSRSDDVPPMIADDAALSRVADVESVLAELSPVGRYRVLLAALAETDPFRDDRRADAVAATGRTILGAVVAAQPLLGHEPRAPSPLAARLWPRLTEQPPSASRVRLLDAVLVLLADHEMATSTLAARVAASTWADPYLVLSAGLAVLGGRLHGGASAEARQLLREAAASSAAGAIGRVLGSGARVPGLGHRVYERNDPRADLLLELLGHPDDTDPLVAEVLDVCAARRLPFPNVDFALAVLMEQHEFIDGASELLFAVARTVGWLAHAIEEYDHALRFRTRAAYVGDAPS